MSETGRRGNLIWNYFDKVDEESKEAECKLCHNLYNYKTTSHNLKNHLKHKHNDEFMNLPAPETVEKKISRRSEGGASVWGYFEVYDGERKIASCNECKKTFSYKTTIHNLKTHLRRVHRDLAVEMEGGECEEVYLDDCDGKCTLGVPVADSEFWWRHLTQDFDNGCDPTETFKVYVGIVGFATGILRALL